MLLNYNGHWFTANAYNFGCLSPDCRSLATIDQDMRRREIFKKYFAVEARKDSQCCFLTYNGHYISAWAKGNKLEAQRVIQAAVSMHIIKGDQGCR